MRNKKYMALVATTPKAHPWVAGHWIRKGCPVFISSGQPFRLVQAYKNSTGPSIGFALNDAPPGYPVEILTHEEAINGYRNP